MRTVRCVLLVLLARQAVCGIIRNPPAFAKPVYSNSYLPAAMQVIFHAVEQLKAAQSEEPVHATSTTTTTPPTPKQTTDRVSTTAIASIQSVDPARDEEKTEAPSKDKVEESPGKQKEEEEEEIHGETEVSKVTENRTLESSFDQKTEESKNPEAAKDDAEERGDPEKSQDETDAAEMPGTSKIEAGTLSSRETEDPATSQERIKESRDPETSRDESEIEEETSKDEADAAGSAESSEEKIEESAEVNEETAETSYATPETNYESPEAVHAVQETNQELPEEEWNREWNSSPETRPEAATASAGVADSTTGPSILQNVAEEREKGNEKKEDRATVDSVVQGVYEILKPTAAKFLDRKNAVGPAMDGTESVDEEEDDDENRFTRLGEKVSQVPRPSLSSYLRRSKIPPSATLQQLANLYDSLSKDARKQGFGKFTGYSDEVLNTLETSAEGGIGPQLRKILDKVLERNELTREDAKTRTTQAVRDLDDPSSSLSKELRPLLPLRYSP